MPQKVTSWRADLARDDEIVFFLEDGGHKRWVDAKVSNSSKGKQGTVVELVLRTDDGLQTRTVSNKCREMQPRMKNRALSIAHLEAFIASAKREIRTGLTMIDTREYLDRSRTIPNPDFNKSVEFDDASTWLVVTYFVKPKVSRLKVPFSDIVEDLFPNLGSCKPTTHFVSHSWGMKFMDTFNALKEAAGKDESAAFWICCFALTQDPERVEVADQNSAAFSEALVARGTTHVLACDSGMLALTRPWVLYEIAVSYNHHKTVVLHPMAVLSTRVGLTMSIQMEKAKCWRDRDQKYIDMQVEKVGGAEALNGFVRNALLRSYDSAIKYEGFTSSNLRLRGQRACVLIELAQFDEALGELEDIMKLVDSTRTTFCCLKVKCFEFSASERSIFLAFLIYNKGRCLTESHADHGTAIKMMKLAVRMGAGLVEREETVAMTLTLVTALRRAGAFMDAANLLNDVKSKRTDHASVLNEAGICLDQGQILSHYLWKNEEAETVLKEAVAGYEACKNEEKLVLLGMTNLGHAIRRQLRYDDALSIYNEVWVRQKQGGFFFDALATRLNIGICLTHLQRFDEAISILSALMAEYSATRPTDPKRFIVQGSYGNLLVQQGRTDEGIAELKKTLEGYRSLVNFQSENEIAWTLANLGEAEMSKFNFSAARAHFEEAIVINKRVFMDADHPSIQKISGLLLLLTQRESESAVVVGNDKGNPTSQGELETAVSKQISTSVAEKVLLFESRNSKGGK